MAEREIGAFISAVTELFGSEQARLATEDWLDELVLIETLPGLMSRRLVNLQNIPILLVVTEASYHAAFDHCTAKYLTQAGREEHFCASWRRWSSL